MAVGIRICSDPCHEAKLKAKNAQKICAGETALRRTQAKSSDEAVGTTELAETKIPGQKETAKQVQVREGEENLDERDAHQQTAGLADEDALEEDTGAAHWPLRGGRES